jgi:predicted signal transduction protein with EAL and GGDEF domain
VLLHQLDSRSDAVHIAERIINALAEPFLIGSREVVIGVSIGIAFGSMEGKTPADAIREADTAMYYAKTSGRSRYCIFDPEMQAGATAKLTLENDLRQAIRSEEFFLVYQPIVRLSSGRIEGFEALCRWKHPRQEDVGPNVFVPLIESLGLTSLLGRAVFDEACEEVLKWNDLAVGGPNISVTVNCSAEEFNQPGFKQNLLLTMATAGIDPQTLRLEVKEAALIGKPEQTRIVMNELRDLGIRIGIDDFGTGFSSLAFLHRIPLDQLKISHSFVHKMLSCSETRDIVRTIVNLAQSLNLDVVAEGVETEEQRDLLYEMGCSHAQGYLYSLPVPGSEVPGVLAGNQKTQSVPRRMHLPDSESTRIETHLQNLDDLMRQQ